MYINIIKYIKTVWLLFILGWVRQISSFIIRHLIRFNKYDIVFQKEIDLKYIYLNLNDQFMSSMKK